VSKKINIIWDSQLFKLFLLDFKSLWIHLPFTYSMLDINTFVPIFGVCLKYIPSEHWVYNIVSYLDKFLDVDYIVIIQLNKNNPWVLEFIDGNT